MGESAVKSHAKVKLHISGVPNQIIMSFFPRNKGSDNAEKSPSSSLSQKTNLHPVLVVKTRIDSMVVSNETIKAEIMWVLKIVISNFSMNSCRNISNLFAEMLNCPIADAFNLTLLNVGI